MEAAERRARRVLASHRAEARMGLSRCHIGPRYWGEVSPHGSYLAVRSSGVSQCKVQTTTRGKVTSFTRRSRSRMLRHFSQIDRDVLSSSLLVTLTYPRSFPTDACTYRRHFHSFSKRLLRAFPSASATWKLEFQSRGAAHYHLIVSGVPFIAKGWLSRAWYAVVGSDDIRHLHAGTQIERCDSHRKALAYAAKYVAKISVGPSANHEGRFWGVVGRSNLHKSVLQWPLERSGHARLARVIRALVGSRSKPTETRRRGVGWCFADGRAGVRAIQFAGGLTWERLQLSSPST